MPDQPIAAYLPPPFVWWIVGGLLTALAGIYVLHQAKLAITTLTRKAATAETPGADILTWIAATIATIVSAQGMWQFIARIIGDVHWSLRGLMFAFLEVAVITSAVRARRNMRDNYTAGADGIAVRAFTALSAVLSAMEAASIPEAIFRLVAPLVAAWLWERGMAIERRRITGRARINWRITPERILVRVGLAEAADRTAGEVDTQRRLTRAALAADRVAETKPGTRTHRRRVAALKRQGRHMVTHTAVSTDESQQEFLMAQLGVARSIAQLADAAPPAFWKGPTTDHTRPVEEVDATATTPALVAGGRNLTDVDGSGRDQATTPTTPRPVATADHEATTTSSDRDQPATTPRGRDRSEADANSDQTTATGPAARRPSPGLHLLPRTATTPRPVARPDGDRDQRPTATRSTDRDQDADATTPATTRPTKKEVVEHVVATAQATGRIPSKRGLEKWSGWGGTSCLEFLKAGRAQLVAEGWTPDATTARTRPGDPEATGRINGPSVVAS